MIVAVEVYSMLPTITRVSAGIKPSPVITTSVPPAIDPKHERSRKIMLKNVQLLTP